jgi:hypothetical protein
MTDALPPSALMPRANGASAQFGTVQGDPAALTVPQPCPSCQPLADLAIERARRQIELRRLAADILAAGEDEREVAR